jgi:hypothetical protein
MSQATTNIEIRSIESNAHLRNENGNNMDFESSIPRAINCVKMMGISTEKCMVFCRWYKDG